MTPSARSTVSSRREESCPQWQPPRSDLHRARDGMSSIPVSHACPFPQSCITILSPDPSPSPLAIHRGKSLPSALRTDLAQRSQHDFLPQLFFLPDNGCMCMTKYLPSGEAADSAGGYPWRYLGRERRVLDGTSSLERNPLLGDDGRASRSGRGYAGGRVVVHRVSGALPSTRMYPRSHSGQPGGR